MANKNEKNDIERLKAAPLYVKFAFAVFIGTLGLLGLGGLALIFLGFFHAPMITSIVVGFIAFFISVAVVGSYLDENEDWTQ